MAIEDYLVVTDQQLVEMRLKGNSVAFEQLFLRYKDSIYALYMHRTGGNRDDSKDLTQETFIKVFLNLDKYNPEYTFGQWVYSIARNTFIDFTRKRRDEFSLDSIDGEANRFTPATKLPSPEQSIIESQQYSQLMHYIEKMTPRYRKLIELRFLNELSYKEIADKLDIPLGTVKTQVHRAREQLFKMITDRSELLSY